jgi:folate-binding protein YgfZ
MNQTWQSLLDAAGARIEGDAVAHFGNAAGELAATEAGTVVVPLTHFGLIRASGEEAAPFLHSLLSNDMQHLSRGRATRAGLCSPKGRMLADFLVWREERDFLLQLSADIHAALLKKLRMYVLRSKVSLADAANELALLGLAGPGAEAALKALGLEVPEDAMALSRFSAGCAIRLDGRRFQLALRTDALAQAWEKLRAHARPAGTPVWRWLDIAAGIPRITAATQEEFVPQMANFELIGGVSFAKGCYPGQEVVARTKYLGKVKRRTYRAHLADGLCPAAGTDLYSPELADQSCGKVIDAVPSPGGGCELLASLQMASAEAGEVHVGSSGGPRLTFRPLPYAID